jgi:hypothetical protein
MEGNYMMNIIYIFLLLFSISLYAQNENCFLYDFEPKNAIVPIFIEQDKISSSPTAAVTTDDADTLGKISKYILGNAIAVWVGNKINNPTFLGYVDKLSLPLIRYPGGSWSNYFFWNGIPKDLPKAGIYIASDSSYKTPQSGTGSWPTTKDNYYSMKSNLDTEGLITINYAYARYGTSNDPVSQAAHCAADWVRYDAGRTKFWEIGNENAGPWEAGWEIDTTLNQDGQPAVITGQLYGKHFKVFADSMRTAAAEINEEIYIGGQILHYDGTNSWNITNRQWNQGFFSEVGDEVDFYVIHNYFGSQINARHLLDVASTAPAEMMTFIQKDISDKSASPKPIALTEWNIQGWKEYEPAKCSIINGMQAVILFCELIKHNYGMSSRWLLANWNADGMLYRGDDPDIPEWCPRPTYYYVYFLPKFLGDHALGTTSDNNDIVAYASAFNSGELGVIIINKGTADQIVKINIRNKTIGAKYYVYTLTGGDDNGDFSQYVYINNEKPSENHFGPIEKLENIPSWAYSIENDIIISTPGRSVSMVMIE